MGAITGRYKRRRILSLTGRANRSEWAGTMVLAIFAITPSSLLPMPWPIFFLGPLAYVALAVSVRRAHDIGWTGWLIAIPVGLTFAVAIPYRALIALGVLAEPGAMGQEAVAVAMQYFAQAVPILFVVILAALGLSPGSDGPNPYGE